MAFLKIIWEKIKPRLPSNLLDSLVTLGLALFVVMLAMLLFGYELTLGSMKFRLSRSVQSSNRLSVDSGEVSLGGYLASEPTVHEEKSLSVPAKFNKKFKGQPTVVLALKYVDLKLDGGRPTTRIDVRFGEYTPDGFKCVFTGWANQPASGGVAVWTAYGEEADQATP